MMTGASTPPSSSRPRRSRLRTFLPLGIAAWLVLEIWLLTVVAGAAGGLTVFLLLIAGFVLGAVVIKRAGRRAFQNLNEALQRGVAPSSGGGSGLMMLGGLLLMLPGLISDAAGLLLLLPPVQKAVGRYAERTVDRGLRRATPGSLGDAFQQARIHRPDGKVVQGEVIREEPGDAPQEPRPPLNR
ncbi:FxsA family protein [Streptomyces spinoverrucosus]|uniref:FxsA family membrane protein n=1 Tax=Streptomyces spinoverrucosus TaxID=284043 RepID=UPI0018C3DDF8|nr:FxsA family membrane protein [Streptomyces spinoverrucosus]MBG0856807.1 FxsA family protein [Streptomyces spinoverrucosus]